MALRRSALPLAVLAGGALAFLAVAAVHANSPGALDVRMPVSLEPSGAPGTIAASTGALAITVAPGAVAFGEVAPGGASAPVEIVVAVAGPAAARLRFDASPLRHADALAAIPPGAMELSGPGLARAVRLDEPVDLDGILVRPGAPATLALTLVVPRGADQWLPAGDYAGEITIFAEVAS